MHVELSGFDYLTGIYYFNVGQGEHRQWSDCKRLGFVSAGQGERWRDAIVGFREGDIIAAYLKGHGFVGIGRIKERAKPISAVTIGDMPLLSHKLDCKKMDDHLGDLELCEYVATVEWIEAVEPPNAKWKAKFGNIHYHSRQGVAGRSAANHQFS
jgi:uncharacterized protein